MLPPEHLDQNLRANINRIDAHSWIPGLPDFDVRILDLDLESWNPVSETWNPVSETWNPRLRLSHGPGAWSLSLGPSWHGPVYLGLGSQAYTTLGTVVHPGMATSAGSGGRAGLGMAVGLNKGPLSHQNGI